MRLLGLLVFCLVLTAGLSLGFERRYELGDRIAENVEGLFISDEVVIDAAPLGLAEENLKRGRAIISMRNAGTLTTLTGLPDFTRVHFDLPKTVTARSGELVLEVAGRLDDHADAILRVSVNGTRRSAVLLGQGALHRKLVLPLNARELAAENLSVAFSVEGNTRASHCTANAASGLVLQVLPTSHLSLQLTKPVTDPADRLLLAGAPARLNWPAQNTDDQALALATAFRLTRTTHDVLFSTDTLGGPSLSLADIAGLAANLPAPTPAKAVDPTDLAAAIGQRRTQDFTTETRWRMPFDTNTLTGSATAVDLALTFASAAQSNAPWLISVYLNDRLIHAQRTEGAEGNIVRRLALPAPMIGRNNVLTVTLRSSARHAGACPTDVPSVAELGTARLVVTDTAQPKPLIGLAAILQSGAGVRIPEALGRMNAQAALDTLKSLSDLGLHARVDLAGAPSDKGADIAVVRPQDLKPALENALQTAAQNGNPVWIAYMSLEQDAGLVTQPVTDISSVVAADLPRAVLVISAAPQGDRT